MSRVAFIGICMLYGLLVSLSGQAQVPGQPGGPGYSYYHPSRDKESWQRLNLLLSSTFLVVAKEGQVEHDTCLYIASRSLGLSRFPVLAEGFGNQELFGQSQWIDRKQPGAGIRLLSGAAGRKRLQLLLLLGAYYAFEPDSYYRYKDSVEYFVNRAVSESKSLKEERLGRLALCLLGKIYVQANDPKGDSVFNLLIDQCRKAGDKETEARAIAYRGIYTAPLPASFQQKVADLQAASDLYHRLGNTEGGINVLMDLGYMLVVSGQLQAANDTFLKALALAEAIRYPYVHYITKALAMATDFQGKFGEPFRYTLQTIRVAESSRDSVGWGYFYSRLSGLYFSEGRSKESLDMTHKAVERFVIDRDPAVYTMLNDIVDQMGREGHASDALNLIGDIAKKVGIPTTFSDLFFYHATFSLCYIDLEKFDLAEMHIRKMDSLETMAEAVRGPLRRSVVNNYHAFLFYKRGEYHRAKAMLERNFAVAQHEPHNMANDLIKWRWLIIVDSALGDNASAVAHYKKYTALLDSNFKVTKMRQAEELQVIYETQEKENQIAVLNQQAALEKDNLKQARLVKNLMLAGIAAVMIIAGLLYRQNRQRKRANNIITHQNEQLQQLITDKEWLLKEIHHRVKNNLQIVMSLLNSQSVYINNDAALTAIRDSRRRVYAMSLIHQKLYQSDNVSSIAMAEYINELVTYIQDSFNNGNRIAFEQQVEPLDLDISQAIPLGLIINESLVNAVKYAFPGERAGVVGISLQQDGNDHLLLNISDNGVGLPDGLDITAHSSLGLDLIRGLAKQLNASVTITSANGLHIMIRFAVMSRQISDENLVNA